MPENAVRTGEGLAYNSVRLSTGIGSADRCLAVGEHDRAHKRRNKSPKQAQRQRMADQIQQDKAPAEPAHIDDEIYEILFGEVMSKVHRERHIGLWKLVSDGVGAPNRKRQVRGSRRADINADNVDAEFVPDIKQHAPARAPDVHDAMDRKRVPPQSRHHRCRVPEKTVDPSKLAIHLVKEGFGDLRQLQDFLLC
jgi:hypothetical protein